MRCVERINAAVVSELASRGVSKGVTPVSAREIILAGPNLVKGIWRGDRALGKPNSAPLVDMAVFSEGSFGFDVEPSPTGPSQ